MKKASLMTAFVLLLTIAVVAQTTTPSTTPSTTPGAATQSQTQATSSNPTSLTGCLSGPTNGVYTLRTLTDNKVYALRSNNPLTSHANHAVTVTGSMEGSAATNSNTTTNTSRSTTATGAANTGATVSAGVSTTDPNAAAGAGNAQATVSAAASAPVFTVTNISMANESCEAGSSAVGTGASTNAQSTNTTTGQTSAGTSVNATGATTPSTTTTTTAAGQVSTQATAPTSTATSGQATAATAPTTATGASTTVAGQTNTSATTDMAGAQGSSLTGCLMASTRDAGRYFIRTTKGKKFITEVIPSPTLSANIAEHVGHQVRLTGQFADGSAAAAGESTMTAQAGNLPQADQARADKPEAGKKAHEQDRNTGRQFTASNIEMVSASGCPQSSTAPNSNKAKKPATKK